MQCSVLGVFMVFAFVLTICAKNWKWDDAQPLQEVKTDQPPATGETGETGETAVKPAEQVVEKPTEEVVKSTEEVGKSTEEAEKPAEGK